MNSMVSPAESTVSIGSRGWFPRSMVEDAFRFIAVRASTALESLFRGHAYTDTNQQSTNHVSSGPVLAPFVGHLNLEPSVTNDPYIRVNEKPDQGENLDEVDRLLNLKKTINRDEYDQISQIVRSKLADNKDKSQPLRQRHENANTDSIFSMVPEDPVWYLSKSCFRKVSALGNSGSLRKVRSKPTLIAPSWEGPRTASSCYIVPPQSSAMASKASQDPVKHAKSCIGSRLLKVLQTKSFFKAQSKPGARKKDTQHPAISPAKQAKPSKASTTNSAFGAQSMIGATSTVQFISEPPYVSFSSKPSHTTAPKYTESGYLSPMRIGRSEIFRMAGAPCPRNPKLLKRKNSPADDDTGYSDFLRRVRQKPTLIVPSDHDSSAPAGYYLLPSQPSDQDSIKIRKRHDFRKIDHDVFYKSVPPQSTAMATKILASLIDPTEGWPQATLAVDKRDPAIEFTSSML